MKLSTSFRRRLAIPTLVSFSLTFVFPTAAFPQQRPQQKKLNIAVLDFDAREGLTPGEATTMSDVFQAHVVTMQEFIVVDRARTKQILEEQGFQASEACSQIECIVEAGKILNVEKMIAGVIGKVGRLYNINIQVVDVQSAQIQATSNRQYAGDIEDVVQDLIPEMANEVAEGLLGRKPQNLASGSSGSGWLWYALGAVVIGGGGAAAYMFLNKTKDTPPVDDKLVDPPTFENLQ